MSVDDTLGSYDLSGGVGKACRIVYPRIRRGLGLRCANHETDTLRGEKKNALQFLRDIA